MSAILTPDQMKADACRRELQAVLRKYGMKMDPKFTATTTGYSLQVDLAPDIPVANPALQGSRPSLPPPGGGK